MTPLPRGRCPYCNAEVALRKGGILREHPDHKHHMYGVAGAVQAGYVPKCVGSGERVDDPQLVADARTQAAWDRANANIEGVRS